MQLITWVYNFLWGDLITIPLPGGSTLGAILNSLVSVTSVDIGMAQLAMHSPYETAGAKDTAYLVQFAKTFYETTLVRTEHGFSLEEK